MDDDFECMTCNALFRQTWFDMSRTVERVLFSGPDQMDEVEISGGEGIATYCSRACHAAGRHAVMQQEGVPIPPIRPGIGPVETCAKCSGPVDMADWHVTFTEGKLEEQGGGIATLEFHYVAVVCKRCLPVVSATSDSIEEAKGMFGKPPRVAGIAEMNEAIATGGE